MTREQALEQALRNLLDAVFILADSRGLTEWPSGRLANAIKDATNALELPVKR